MITDGDYQKEIDSNVQSSTSQLFQYLLINEIKTDITLTQAVSEDDEVINVSTGHGFLGYKVTVGEQLVIRYGDLFSQLRVASVTSDALTLEMPIDNDFPIDGTTIIRGNSNMNINGVATPTDFKFAYPAGSGALVPFDITAVTISMQSGAAVPDDGQFGAVDELDNGMYFRKLNGGTTNLGNYINNQEFRNIGAKVEYTQKAPAGTFATNITINFSDAFGFNQVIRMDPKENDAILAHVRDKIDAAEGMAMMTISITGSFTVGE